jgi:diguanylate cyclase (GGDEF)-like protein
VTSFFKFITDRVKNPRMVVPIAVCLGFGFFAFDAFIDATFFDEDRRGFLTNLVDPEPMDIWMRMVVFVLIVSFSLYARFLMRGLVALTDELTEQRDSLAQRVAEATEELQMRNNSLEDEILLRNNLEADLRELAITDPLTRLFNRRKFLEDMAAANLVDRRYKTGIAIILCDIDRFKTINDTNGHDVGDAVLIRFAEILKKNTRETDIVARWGGEEFAILVASNEATKVVAIAEKLRQSIQDATFPRSLSVTASFGVAILGGDGDIDTLMGDADKALYRVKAEGRNAVRFFGEPASQAP